MVTKVKYGDNSRQVLKEGVDDVANAVKVTMGARGRNVIINKGIPHITKDGVTVAEAIFFEDPLKNLGAMLVKEAAQNTCDSAGDGTTATSVLVQAIFNEGLTAIDNNCNPMDLKKGIDYAVSNVVKFIKDNCRKVDESNIREIATVSANNDSHIGGLIADAFEKIGSNGDVKVKEAKGFKTSLEIVDGIKFDNGMYSHYFADSEKGECILENPYILISDKNIKDITAIMPILNAVREADRSLLIMCRDMDVQVHGTLAVNKQKGMFSSCVVKTPSFGIPTKEWLEDFAVLTGGIVISDEKADKLANLTLADLGQAKRAVISKSETTIMECFGDKAECLEAMVSLDSNLKTEKEEHKKDILKQRIANLNGYVAILSIGGNSETEIKEKADRVDDSVKAVKAAKEEGVVPGGGSIYIHAAVKLPYDSANKNIQMGIEIIRKALYAPFNTILYNAGLTHDIAIDDVAIVTGFDVVKEKVCDMYEAGIIDPAKVARVALENAASVAGNLLTTECSIAYEDDSK